MTEHSPGPWRLAAVSDGAWVQDRDGFYVAEIDSEAVGYGPEPERMSADARLIAAAPMLYTYVQTLAERGGDEARAIIEKIAG